MEKKATTPERKARRTYEERNKDARKAQNKVWGTSIPRTDAEEIDDFLAKYNLSKVDLIYAGYMTLQERTGANKGNK